MPRRRRTSKTRYELTLPVLNASIDQGAWVAEFGSEEDAAEAWRSLRLQLLDGQNLGARPEPFWAYEGDVPDGLRGDGSVSGAEDLAEARLRWLLGEGQDHLRTGETYHIRRALGLQAAPIS